MTDGIDRIAWISGWLVPTAFTDILGGGSGRDILDCRQLGNDRMYSVADICCFRLGEFDTKLRAKFCQLLLRYRLQVLVS